MVRGVALTQAVIRSLVNTEMIDDMKELLHLQTVAGMWAVSATGNEMGRVLSPGQTAISMLVGTSTINATVRALSPGRVATVMLVGT
jgi:hypothetical protein